MALTQKEISRICYKNRKDNGLCPRCGEKLDRTGYYCSKCLIKVREYNRKNKEFYRTNEICPVCGKEKLFGDEKQCIDCREKNIQRKTTLSEKQKLKYNQRFRNQQNNLYEERTKKGICTRCGKRKSAYGKKKCQICLDKDAEIHRIKWHKQKEEMQNVNKGGLLCQNQHISEEKN